MTIPKTVVLPEGLQLNPGDEITIDFDQYGLTGFSIKRAKVDPQFAPVCGVQMYETMAIMGQLPKYHLLLAHDILSTDERRARYRRVFQPLRYPDSTIIMDNSITELGSAVDSETVAVAAQTVNANVIVLPDVYEDAAGTVQMTKDHYWPWKKRMDEYLGENNYSFMVVPQGKTVQEFAWCAGELANPNYDKIHWWGVPRNAVHHHGTRLHALRLCAMFDPTKAIHMLGFSDNIVDDILTLKYGGIPVMGIDSAVPLRWSDNLLHSTKPFHIGVTAEQVGKRSKDWLVSAELTDQVIRDWKYTEQLVRGV